MLPTLDLAVPFEYDSSELTGRAMPVLVKPSQALLDDRLAGSTFIVGGYTNARERTIRVSNER